MRARAQIGLPAGTSAFGIHTGEVALAADEVTGDAVVISQELAALAQTGRGARLAHCQGPGRRVWHEFADRGSHRLGASAESWYLYAADLARPEHERWLRRRLQATTWCRSDPLEPSGAECYLSFCGMPAVIVVLDGSDRCEIT